MRETVEERKRLDLRGEVCPYTLVKTALALEEIAPGQVLEVTVDYAPAAEEVPMSVANRGHEVLAVRQATDSDWTITVRKGEEREA